MLVPIPPQKLINYIPKEDFLGHFTQNPDCPTLVGARALAQVLGTGLCSPSLWEAKRCREAISIFFFPISRCFYIRFLASLQEA